MKVGVLLIEPDRDMRYWLGRLIDQTEGFSLQGCCASPADLEEMAARLSPDLILMDRKAAAGLESGMLANLREKLPGLYVALTGLDGDGIYQRGAVESGADSFFEKCRAPQSLVKLREQILEMSQGAAKRG